MFLLQNVGGRALYDGIRTVAWARVRIVQRRFPLYGRIIAPVRVWRQIVQWTAFFLKEKLRFQFFKDNKSTVRFVTKPTQEQ